MESATAWCDGGPADGDLVTVPLDRTNLPPKFIRRTALALDEQTETAWWVGIRYGLAPFSRLPRAGEPWRYVHMPPTRLHGA